MLSAGREVCRQTRCGFSLAWIVARLAASALLAASTQLVAPAALLAEPGSDAVDSARVRIEFKVPETIWVGQHVTFYIEVLTATSFEKNPHFELPQVSGALLLKPQMFPLTSEKDLDGTHYAVQSHQFAIFPQRPGEITVSPIGVRFSSPTEGATPHLQELQTQALRFTAQLPPGAEHLSLLVSTRELTVRQTWEPEPGSAKVGDAFTRTVIWQAPDMLGMAFPPLTIRKTNGLAVYRREPEVEDKIFRGQMTATRRESFTYVCEAPGEYALPALVIPWFDVDSKRLEKIQLSAATLHVAEIPEGGSAGSGRSSPVPLVDHRGTRWARVLVTFLFLIPLATWLLRKRWAELLLAWKRSRHEREDAYFDRLERVCRSDDAVASFNTLMLWLERISSKTESATIASFAQEQGDSELAEELRSLQQAVVLRTPWSGANLAATLSRVRKKRLAGAPKQATSLPPLNPGPLAPK